MLLLHLASVFFLFEIARKLSGGLLAPVIATFLFNFSPLAVYYQRMVLLDNLMVVGVLLSIYLLLRSRARLFTGVLVGPGLRHIRDYQGERDILRADPYLPAQPPN